MPCLFRATSPAITRELAMAYYPEGAEETELQAKGNRDVSEHEHQPTGLGNFELEKLNGALIALPWGMLATGEKVAHSVFRLFRSVSQNCTGLDGCSRPRKHPPSITLGIGNGGGVFPAPISGSSLGFDLCSVGLWPAYFGLIVSGMHTTTTDERTKSTFFRENRVGIHCKSGIPTKIVIQKIQSRLYLGEGNMMTPDIENGKKFDSCAAALREGKNLNLKDFELVWIR